MVLKSNKHNYVEWFSNWKRNESFKIFYACLYMISTYCMRIFLRRTAGWNITVSRYPPRALANPQYFTDEITDRKISRFLHYRARENCHFPSILKKTEEPSVMMQKCLYISMLHIFKVLLPYSNRHFDLYRQIQNKNANNPTHCKRRMFALGIQSGSYPREPPPDCNSYNSYWQYEIQCNSCNSM